MWKSLLSNKLLKSLTISFFLPPRIHFHLFFCENNGWRVALQSSVPVPRFDAENKRGKGFLVEQLNSLVLIKPSSAWDYKNWLSPYNYWTFDWDNNVKDIMEIFHDKQVKSWWEMEGLFQKIQLHNIYFKTQIYAFRHHLCGAALIRGSNIYFERNRKDQAVIRLIFILVTTDPRRITILKAFTYTTTIQSLRMLMQTLD